ncbi:MAG: sialate O-acetylesterase [bacterium]
MKKVNGLLVALVLMVSVLVTHAAPDDNLKPANGSGEGSDQAVTPMQPVDITKLPPGVKRLDLFLLIGQSNMQGAGKLPAKQTPNPRIVMMHLTNDQWYVAQHPLHFNGDPVTMKGCQMGRGVGPGLAFAEAVIAREPDVMVGLIPCAKGGSSIDVWRKGNASTLYDRAVQRVRLALEQAPPGKARLCAALWLQGESDSNENRYPLYKDHLFKLVDNLRADFEQPNLPFIACTIGSFIVDRERKRNIPQKFAWTRFRDINAVLLGLPSYRPGTACVDALDLVNGHIGDYVHYSSEAQAIIGQRYAQEYFRLVPIPMDDESMGNKRLESVLEK